MQSHCFALLSRDEKKLVFDDAVILQPGAAESSLTLVPKIVQHGLLSFRKWYCRYRLYLQEMFVVLTRILDASDQRAYLYVDYEGLYRSFVQFAYSCSSNTSKTFQWDLL